MTSLELSIFLEMQHFSITRLIDKYKKELRFFGALEIEKITPDKGTQGGRPLNIVYLNEAQKNLLIVLLKNNNKTIEIKRELIKKMMEGKINEN
jgi:phage regulator Rha-like protein